MDFRVLLVITPIVFSWIFTVFWLGRWDVFRLTPLGLPKKGVAPFKNYQVWEDSALIPDTGRPAEGYPVFTVFWLGRWDVFRLTPLGLPKKGVAPFKNYQVWEDSALIPDTGRPAEGYPVFTVRTAAVNALGIPTVFFLGAILAMQFKSY